MHYHKSMSYKVLKNMNEFIYKCRLQQQCQKLLSGFYPGNFVWTSLATTTLYNYIINNTEVLREGKMLR